MKQFVKFRTDDSMEGKDPLSLCLINPEHVVMAVPQVDGTTCLYLADGRNVEVACAFDVVASKLNMGAR